MFITLCKTQNMLGLRLSSPLARSSIIYRLICVDTLQRLSRLMARLCHVWPILRGGGLFLMLIIIIIGKYKHFLFYSLHEIYFSGLNFANVQDFTFTISQV